MSAEQAYPHLHIVVLAADEGEALWPLGRAGAPMCFAPSGPGSKLSMLSAAVLRSRALSEHPVHVVTLPELEDQVSEELQGSAGLAPDDYDIWCVPSGRGDAFSAALACARVRRKDPDAVVAAVPASLLVNDTERWAPLVYHAYLIALRDRIALVGARQSEARSGAVYLRRGAQFEGTEDAFAVRALVDGTRLSAAQRALSEGASWYTGMCVARAAVLLGAFAHADDSSRDAALAGIGRIAETAAFLALLDPAAVQTPEAAEIIAALPHVNFTRSVLAASDRLVLVPTTIEFSSLMTLADLDALSEKDAQGNRAYGQALGVASRNVTSYSTDPHRLIVSYGLDDLYIVDTPDAVLVADRRSAQEHAPLLEALEDSGVPQLHQSRTHAYPWGTATLLSEETHASAWRLDIRAGATVENLNLLEDFGVCASARSDARYVVRQQAVLLAGNVLTVIADSDEPAQLHAPGGVFGCNVGQGLEIMCVEEAPAVVMYTAALSIAS